MRRLLSSVRTAPLSESVYLLSRSRGCSSNAKEQGRGGPVGPSCTPESLSDEVHAALSAPLPVGNLFRALSPAAKSFLASEQLSLEQFLLRNGNNFAVFQEPRDKTIMVSRARHVPPHALRGVEATGDQIFNGKLGHSETQAVVTILKYVPNEWSAFTDLGIPESIRVNVMQRKAKAYFERHPQFFEVQAQSLNQHTFFVRRALSLQKQMDSTAAATARGSSDPPSAK